MELDHHKSLGLYTSRPIKVGAFRANFEIREINLSRLGTWSPGPGIFSNVITKNKLKTIPWSSRSYTGLIFTF